MKPRYPASVVWICEAICIGLGYVWGRYGLSTFLAAAFVTSIFLLAIIGLFHVLTAALDRHL